MCLWLEEKERERERGKVVQNKESPSNVTKDYKIPAIELYFSSRKTVQITHF